MSAGLNENIYMYFITINMKLQKKEAITFHHEQHGMSFTEPGFRRRVIVRIKLYIYTYMFTKETLFFVGRGLFLNNRNYMGSYPTSKTHK